MLATLGFLITGVFFGVFATTFLALVARGSKLQLKQFGYAYYMLGLAFLGYGLASAVGSQGWLEASVLAGNVFLLAGTLCMLDLVLPQRQRLFWRLALVTIGAALLYMRVTLYPPDPYILKGVLIFNSQAPVAITLGLLFVGVWLPINIRVARQVVRAVKQESIEMVYSWLYTLATVSALLFLAARRTTTVVLSFIAISICFALLILSNVVVKSLGEHRGKRRS